MIIGVYVIINIVEKNKLKVKWELYLWLYECVVDLYLLVSLILSFVGVEWLIISLYYCYLVRFEIMG